jgi:hypothetical protein
VLRGVRERFAFGALTAAVETVILLHVANPDALIVRVNASRQDSPVVFDALYAATLSGDAVPALLHRLDAVPADARCPAVERLLRTWSGEGEDWRAWSLGRSRALGAVAARRAELRALCPAPKPAVATAAVRPPQGVSVDAVPVTPKAPSGAAASTATPTSAPAADVQPGAAPAATPAAATVPADPSAAAVSNGAGVRGRP